MPNFLLISLVGFLSFFASVDVCANSEIEDDGRFSGGKTNSLRNVSFLYGKELTEDITSPLWEGRCIQLNREGTCSPDVEDRSGGQFGLMTTALRYAPYSTQVSEDNMAQKERVLNINNVQYTFTPLTAENVLSVGFSVWDNYTLLIVASIGLPILILLLLVTCRRWTRWCRKAPRRMTDEFKFITSTLNDTSVVCYLTDEKALLVDCNGAYANFFQADRESLLDTTQPNNSDRPEPIYQQDMDTLKYGWPIFACQDFQFKEELYRVFHWSYPLKNPAGEIVGMIGGWLDIREPEGLLEELFLAREVAVKAVEANNAKSLFLANISHEIRVPISALVGVLELMRTRSDGRAQIKEQLLIAYQSAQSLLSLVGNILDLSKIEAGGQQLSLQPASIVEVVQSVFNLFEVSAYKKNLECTLVVDVSNSKLMIDSLILNQIVSNFLNNAIKFTDSGRVELSLRELPDARLPGHGRFEIKVSDTGIGVSEQQMGSIFEPFVQVLPAQGIPQGAGLGLSICTRLADMLSADLRVESEVGKGSCFSLLFEAEIIEGPTSEPTLDVSAHRLNVLVAEDHAINRRLLCQQLEMLGHHVVSCQDGESALRSWQSASPAFDVTITDCAMPDLDGFELTRRIRALEQDYAIRPHAIIGLTASAQVEIASRGLASGMNQCLFKPVSVEVLKNLLDGVYLQSLEFKQVPRIERLKTLNSEGYWFLAGQMIDLNREDCKTLEGLLRKSKFKEAEYLVHKVKGGAKIAGANSLIVACTQMELYIQQGAPIQCIQQVEHISNAMLELEKRLFADR